MDKVYIVRKYIIAKSAQEALKKEPKTKVDDVWVDDDTHKELLKAKILESNKIGFTK